MVEAKKMAKKAKSQGQAIKKMFTLKHVGTFLDKGNEYDKGEHDGKTWDLARARRRDGFRLSGLRSPWK